MNRRSSSTAVLAVFVVLFVACGGEKETPSDATTPGASSSTQPAVASSSASAELDLQFLDAMRKHHEVAVEMAKLAGERTEDPKIRSMATKVAADQQKEIAQLTTWRDQWFSDAPPADVTKLPGAASMNMDMSHMQSLKGHQFDMMFADMMMPHHEGAVTMSCEVHGRSGRDEIRQFARGVIRAQEKEISELAAWKKSMGMPSSP